MTRSRKPADVTYTNFQGVIPHSINMGHRVIEDRDYNAKVQKRWERQIMNKLAARGITLGPNIDLAKLK